MALEREIHGGQAGTSSLIRRYLGFQHGISGKSWPDGRSSRRGCSAQR